MKLLKLTLFSFLLLTGFNKARAGELSLRTDDTVTGNQISLGFNSSTLTAEGGTIQGSGIKVDFTHYFASKLSMELNLAAAFSMDSKIQNSFTGLGGIVYYTLTGQCFETRSNVYVNEMLIASEATTQSRCFRVGGGLQQYFLNGSKNIYSGSGLGVSAAYHFNLWDYNFKATGGYSMISAGKTQLGNINLGISFIFSL